MSRVFPILYVLCAVVCIAFTADVKEGTCQCAVFKMEMLHDTCKPLISRTPAFAVTCDDSGKESCAKMCTALAQAAKEQAPEMICAVMETNDEGVKPSVFSKTCDAEEWTFTGMTAKEAICCADSKAIACTPDTNA